MDVLVGIIIGAVIVIAAIAVALRIRSKRNHISSPKAHPMSARATGDGAQVAVFDDSAFEPVNITLPDILQFELGAYLIYGIIRNHIRGAVTYQEGKYIWKEYYLSDTSWLGAEEDDGPELISWERIVASDLEPNGKKPLVHQGVTYEFNERGSASYRVEGHAGDLSGSGTMEYVDYATPDGQNHLSLERYDGDGDWEAALGESVVISMIEYYPPSAEVSDTNQR